jgi:hypothetical protein
MVTASTRHDARGGPGSVPAVAGVAVAAVASSFRSLEV